MKNILLIALISSTLFACVEVKFKNAQPIKTKKLTEFPQELQGKYLFSIKDTLNEKDTFVIGKNYFSEFVFGEKPSNSSNKNIPLSDSLLLKKIDNNYTLSFKEKKLWTVILIKPNKDGHGIFWIEGEDEDTAEQLNLTTKVETIKDEDGKIKSYVLDPKKKEFMKMTTNKYIFSKLYDLKKINP